MLMLENNQLQNRNSTHHTVIIYSLRHEHEQSPYTQKKGHHKRNYG